MTALAGLRPVSQGQGEALLKTDGPGQVSRWSSRTPRPTWPSRSSSASYETGTDEMVLPIFLDDNYVTLLPGEKRKVAGVFAPRTWAGQQPGSRSGAGTSSKG